MCLPTRIACQRYTHLKEGVCWCRQVSGHLDSSVSQAASWVGTVTYMSPERIRGAPYGVSSDVWSLGLTLLEAAIGRFPYPSEGVSPTTAAVCC